MRSSLIFRIWDTVIGGSSLLLVYVAVTLLLTFKRALTSGSDIAGFLKHLTMVFHFFTPLDGKI